MRTRWAVGSMLAIFTLATIFPMLCPVVRGRDGGAFDPTEQFAVPERNGSIRFALNGTYEQATLNDGVWNFVNLNFNGSLGAQSPLNLSASAQDSNVSITRYNRFNITFSGYSLRYVVSGQGKQSFNFHLTQGGGEWSVTYNGNFVGENEGFTVATDGTVTVTDAPSNANVTITYYFLPDAFGNENTSTQSFFQQHSVVIITAVAVGIGIALATTIRLAAKKKQSPNLGESRFGKIE